MYWIFIYRKLYENEKIRNPLCLKNTLVIIFISFTTINCESNKDILVNNDWFNVATIVSMADIPIPELSEEEATLIDSILEWKSS